MHNGMMTRQDLDDDGKRGCSVCGETHHSIRYFTSKCHPNCSLEVAYDSLGGASVITCGKCERLVMRVKVGDEHDTNPDAI